MSVREIIRERFKGPTKPVPRDVTVQTSITDVMLNSPDRFGWVIVNLSVNRGRFGFDRQVSATHGFTIEASGGVASATWEEDGEATTYAVFGYNEVAAGAWHVVEFVRF